MAVTYLVDELLIGHMRTTENAGVAGLVGGAVAGVIMAGIVLILLLVLKSDVINTLASATQNAGGNVPSPEALYQTTLITGPVTLFFINLVVGAIIGFALGRLVPDRRLMLLGVSVIVGAVVGFLVNLPVGRLVTAGVGVVAWVVYAGVFSRFYAVPAPHTNE